MVRFKNRYIIVEFLQFSSLSPAYPPPSQVNQPSKSNQPNLNAKQRVDGDFHDDKDEDEDEDEADGYFYPIPTVPFLLPAPPDLNDLAKREDGGKAVYRAVKNCVQEVFGDEGWGRVGSSFKVIYHSPLTTLTILRIARPHIRTLMAGITLLTELRDDQRVTPRVLGISGTIKKAQGRIGIYHRAVVAGLMAAVEGGSLVAPPTSAQRTQRDRTAEQDRKALEGIVDREQQEMNNIKE